VVYGNIDECGYWSTALTSSEITQLYNFGQVRLILFSTDFNPPSQATLSTYYVYNGLGNLINITDASGNIRNFTYDNLGRKLAAQDLHVPNDQTFGVYRYSYDDAGNIISKQIQ